MLNDLFKRLRHLVEQRDFALPLLKFPKKWHRGFKLLALIRAQFWQTFIRQLFTQWKNHKFAQKGKKSAFSIHCENFRRFRQRKLNKKEN